MSAQVTVSEARAHGVHTASADFSCGRGRIWTEKGPVRLEREAAGTLKKLDQRVLLRDQEESSGAVYSSAR